MTSRQARRAPLPAPGALPRWPPTRRNPRGKRALDLMLACVCLVVAAPLLAAVAVLVRVTTPGPALFRQVRLGQHRHPFRLYKVRTMYDGCTDGAHREYVRRLLTEDQPAPGARAGVYKLAGDSRVTAVGRLLRRMSIDELPQLLNVIRGDMSLVGPRPALPWEAELIGATHGQRFDVPPGLTGLWQVSGRNALTMRQALDLDVQYVAAQSLWLDLAILARTVPVVLSARGAL